MVVTPQSDTAICYRGAPETAAGESRALISAIISLKGQYGVGAAKAKTIRDHGVELDAVHTIGHDGCITHQWIKVIDISRGTDKVVLKHQQTVNSFVYTGGTQRMT